MNSDFSKISKEERELQITALILGELAPAEAEGVSQAIGADAELAREFERHKQTIELVREIAAMDRKVSADGTPLKLDEERRQKLLERFKMPPPGEAAPRRQRNLWYVPLSLAAALVGLLVAAVALPGLSKAKARAQRSYAVGGIARLSSLGNQSEFAGESAAEGWKHQWSMQNAARLPGEAPAAKLPSAGSRTSARGANIALPAAVAEDGRVQISGQVADLGAERMLVEQLAEQPINASLSVGRKFEIDRKLDRANDSFAIAAGSSSDGLILNQEIANNPRPLSGGLPVLAGPAPEMKRSSTVAASDSTRVIVENSGSMMGPTWGATDSGVVSLTITPSSGFASSYFLNEFDSHSAASPPGGFPATAPVPSQAPLALGGSVFSMDAIGYANVKREPAANPIANSSKPSSDFVDLYANGAIALGDKEVAATTRQNGQQNVALYDNDYDQAAVAAQIRSVGGGGAIYAGVNVAGQKDDRGQAVGGGVFGGGSAQLREVGSSTESGRVGSGGRGSFGNRLGGTAQVAAGRFDVIVRPGSPWTNAGTVRGFYDDNVSTASISAPTRAASDVNGRFAFQFSEPANDAQFNRESSPTRAREESKAAAGPRNYAVESLQGVDAAGLPIALEERKEMLAQRTSQSQSADVSGPVVSKRVEDEIYIKNAALTETEFRIRPQIQPQPLQEQLAQIIETKKTDGPTVLSANISTSPIRSVPPRTTEVELRAGGVTTLDGSVHPTPSPQLNEFVNHERTNQSLHFLKAKNGREGDKPALSNSSSFTRADSLTALVISNGVLAASPAESIANGRVAIQLPDLATEDQLSRQSSPTRLFGDPVWVGVLDKNTVLAGDSTVAVDFAGLPVAPAAEESNDKLAKITGKPATGGALQGTNVSGGFVVSRKSSAEPEVERRAPAKPSVPAPTPQPEVLARDNAFSTFSLNVSDVSFKLAAASLEKGSMPEVASLRSEEFLNAFDYRDPLPAAGAPIAFAWERARYPFAHNRDALRFSVKTAAQGREVGKPLNIVLLLDNSGSMERSDRVRIIQESLRSLAAQLQPQDKLSVVTFSRTPRLWADGVTGAQAAGVANKIAALTPEGGTNLEDALDLAYRTALRHYAATAVNRVVLLTDGAANLGNVEPKTLKAKVEGFRKQGVALDCFGIGWDGFNDDLLEQLSRNGDGRYGFVNTPEEAATEFVGQLAGALRVAASDVKVQVEFNPKRVTAYRQIGYAKHQLTKQQFRDNTVDAAEIGAAEAGNGLYIIETNPRGEGPIATVRARFRIPQTSDYHEQEWVVPYGSAVEVEQSSTAMRLAVSASAFSEWLASSPFSGEVTTDRLLSLMSGVPEVFGADARPKRLEWMIRQAKSISGK